MEWTFSHTGKHPGKTANNASPARIRHMWNTALRALAILPEKSWTDRGTRKSAVSGPDISSEPPASDTSLRPDLGGYAVALECVRLVIAWYNSAIYDEQRAPSPDSGRLEKLNAERRRCLADRKSLAHADPEEITRVARDYGARFQCLTAVS